MQQNPETPFDDLKGLVAVVTGAAQGNGKAIATALAQYGVSVALCDIQGDAVHQLAEQLNDQGLRAQAYCVDVSVAHDCQVLAGSVAKDLGPTAILINNAGIIRRTSPDAATFETDWSDIMRVNTDGPMFMIRAFLGQLRQTRGSIVNMASIMSVSGAPGMSAYAASKGAVLQMTRALAHDLAPDGIRVNAIAPGVIDTPMTEVTRNNPDAIARFMAHTPMRRTGKPQELVGPVLFLVSNMSTYVTGILLPVDGGYLTA